MYVCLFVCMYVYKWRRHLKFLLLLFSVFEKSKNFVGDTAVCMYVCMYV